MIKAIFRFVITLALGLLIGYVLAPTIDKQLTKKMSPEQSEKFQGMRGYANDLTEDGIASLQNK